MMKKVINLVDLKLFQLNNINSKMAGLGRSPLYPAIFYHALILIIIFLSLTFQDN